MRIRKRFLSLSAATTTTPTPPSSDLPAGHHHHKPVQHQELHPNRNQHVAYHDTTQIGLQPSTWVPSGGCSHPNNTKILKELQSERKKEFIKAEDIGCRKESVLCAEAKNHDLVLKGWLEGDRLVPVKKKRGSCGKGMNGDVVQDNEMIEGTKKPKAKTNDKCGAMSSKREGVIMEGSRCSRVNGRGWRCSQQTLVGYSLCEHHLGKGRLRSASSICGGRAQRVALKGQHIKERKDKQAQSPAVEDHDEVKDADDYDDDDEEDEEFKDWDVESKSAMEGTKVFGKKRKLGMVKARSLSSLLSQIGS